MLTNFSTTDRALLLDAQNLIPDNTGEISTLEEVAAYLTVGNRTVYRLAAAKKMPAFKVGGSWGFSRAEIDDWIRCQSSGSSIDLSDAGRSAG